MPQVVNKPRGGARIQSAKVVERRSRIYTQLLEESAALFADRGMEAVSVEDIIAAVGISRRTFYGFFANKYEIVGALLNPIFTAGVTRLRELDQGATELILPGIVDFYLQQWQDNQTALQLINALEPAAFSYIEAGHRRFARALQRSLASCEAARLLRNGSAAYSFKLISRTAIPLLKVYQDHPELPHLYRETMVTLLAKSK